MNSRKNATLAGLALLALVLLAPLPVLAASAIGSVLLSKGVVTSLSAAGELRTLAKKSEVFVKDTITTAQDSFVVIKMIDDTKLTMRPNSEITLDGYSEEEGKESATIGLIKGGLRTLTGAIGKKRPEEFRINTAIATIGIRGTDFITRLCQDKLVDGQIQNQCASEEQRLASFQRLAGLPASRSKKITDSSGEQSRERSSVECKPVAEIKEGLYVALFEGKINIASKSEEVDIEAVSAVFVEQREVVCLDQVPNFLSLDDYLSDDPGKTITLFNILQNIDDENLQCIVPEG